MQSITDNQTRPLPPLFGKGGQGGEANYHSHSLYCDGRAGMEDFVRFAVSRGFVSYGFSSHAPEEQKHSRSR